MAHKDSELRRDALQAQREIIEMELWQLDLELDCDLQIDVTDDDSLVVLRQISTGQEVRISRSGLYLMTNYLVKIQGEMIDRDS